VDIDGNEGDITIS